MSDDRNDHPAHLLFLAAMAVVVLILIGWFVSGPSTASRSVRDCNIVTVADRRSDCFPAEDQSRR
jgi:hypothetical protein